MAEFGEQLRKAREAKGMTQQTLAEYLYVTRQAVSRWECGDRYPDLITAKKLSTILEVSLDELMSNDEMKRVTERNQVIEKPFMKNVLVALYAFVSFSFLITVVDIIIRFPLSSPKMDYQDIQLIAVNVTGLALQTAVFVYGFLMALKGSLTPKKTGAVLTLYFASLCLTNSLRLTNGDLGWRAVLTDLLLAVPCLAGALSSWQFFYQGKNSLVWYRLLIAASLWGTALIVANTWAAIRYAGQFVSMNTALNLLLKICIYLLVIYQAYTMRQKREGSLMER